MLSTSPKAIIYTSPTHSLYVGRVERLLTRVSVSPTLIVSLEEDLELIDPASQARLRSNSLLIPAGSQVTVDTHGAKVAMGFLDDLGHDFARLAAQASTQVPHGAAHIHANLYHAPEIIRQADYLSCQRPATANAFELFEAWMGTPAATVTSVVDSRVARAVALIKESANQNQSVADVARQVNLSVPRLIQLFKQQTGTPIRRFRLWQRIFVTATKLTQGYSLTDAAVAAGFSDYAQFSRVYRELAGGAPAAAKNNTEIRVHAH